MGIAQEVLKGGLNKLVAQEVQLFQLVVLSCVYGDCGTVSDMSNGDGVLVG